MQEKLHLQSSNIRGKNCRDVLLLRKSNCLLFFLMMGWGEGGGEGVHGTCCSSIWSFLSTGKKSANYSFALIRRARISPRLLLIGSPVGMILVGLVMDQISIKASNPNCRLFLKNWPAKVFGGRWISVWCPSYDPVLPPPLTHCTVYVCKLTTLYYTVYLFRQGRGGVGKS